MIKIQGRIKGGRRIDGVDNKCIDYPGANDISIELNGHQDFLFSFLVQNFLNGPAFLSPPPPLNGLAISVGTFFAASLRELVKRQG